MNASAGRKSTWRATAALAVGMTLSLPRSAAAEEIWLADGSRMYGLIAQGEPGAFVIRMPDGSEVRRAIDEIVAIRFQGRNPRLVQAGAQEFRFVNGGSLRGQIVGNAGDKLRVETALAGEVHADFARLAGFVAMPIAGFIGRRSDELVENGPPFEPRAVYQDALLDQRGSLYFGALRSLDRVNMQYYVEDLVKAVPVRISFAAGLRLADAERDAARPWAGADTQVRFFSRDGSVVRGRIEGIRRDRWQVRPAWDEGEVLALDVNEVEMVQVLGGRTVYLSQLAPSAAREATRLAPPQAFRMDRDCQGNALSIAGARYLWGIGVHADSELTFDLNGGYEAFQSDIGIATRMGSEGSVVFSVHGDGRELYRSPLVRGSDPAAARIEISVAGVKKLTLKAEDGGDTDLGDVANWGGAKLFRRRSPPDVPPAGP